MPNACKFMLANQGIWNWAYYVLKKSFWNISGILIACILKVVFVDY